MHVLTRDGETASIGVHSAGFSLTGDVPSTPITISTGGSSVPIIEAGETFRRSWVDYGTIYRSNPWLWAVVNLIARSAARMPSKVYRDPEPGGVRERVYPGRSAQAPRLALSLRRPGGGVAWQALKYATTVDRLVRGNALWRIRDDRTGVVGFDRFPWREISVKHDSGVYQYTRRVAGGDDVVMLEDEVIHFGFWADAESAVNPSPISSLHATLAMFDAVYRHLVAYFANGAHVGGHFKLDKDASTEVIDRVGEVIKEFFAGPENAGRTMVTSASWESMADTPEHSRVIDLAKQSREEICGAYGVAPPLVGILDRAIMSNVRELRSHTSRDTTGPHVELMDGDLVAQLVHKRPALDGVFVESEMSAALKPDPEAFAQTIPNQLRIRTPNELRRTQNLPPLDVDGADELWLPNAGDDTGEGGDPDDEPDPPSRQGD
ncbi:MAG: phage portal protein [Actinomycetia bacterium]|nr:phage portal protein [Actinomycetes bacterium]